jgi:hypothetical protein
VKLPDGRNLFTGGSSPDEQPQQQGVGITGNIRTSIFLAATLMLALS